MADYITCSRCGIVPRGHRCPYKTYKKKAYDTEADKFRKTKRWTNKSIEVRQRDRYLCKVCEANLYNTIQRFTFNEIAAFVYFLANGWNLKYYLLAALALSASCIMTYWLYENTCLRNLIGLVGSMALRKAFGLVVLAVNTNDIAEIKSEANKVVEELTAQTSKEIKQTVNAIKEDDDLKGL